jgi:hypothetical protein
MVVYSLLELGIWTYLDDLGDEIWQDFVLLDLGCVIRNLLHHA